MVLGFIMRDKNEPSSERRAAGKWLWEAAFGRPVHREGDFVQDVGGLMHPTPLMPRAGKDLVERPPEAERARALQLIVGRSDGGPPARARRLRKRRTRVPFGRQAVTFSMFIGD